MENPTNLPEIVFGDRVRAEKGVSRFHAGGTQGRQVERMHGQLSLAAAVLLLLDLPVQRILPRHTLREHVGTFIYKYLYVHLLIENVAGDRSGPAVCSHALCYL